MRRSPRHGSTPTHWRCDEQPALCAATAGVPPLRPLTPLAACPLLRRPPAGKLCCSVGSCASSDALRFPASMFLQNRWVGCTPSSWGSGRLLGGEGEGRVQRGGSTLGVARLWIMWSGRRRCRPDSQERCGALHVAQAERGPCAGNSALARRRPCGATCRGARACPAAPAVRYRRGWHAAGK